MTSAGEGIVAMGVDGRAVADCVSALRAEGRRAAGFVGHDRAAAEAMAAELFGSSTSLRECRQDGAMPEFLGVSHVDLTVRDVQASAEWYQRVFGLKTLMETKEEDRSAVVMFHPVNHLAICVGSHVANDGQPFDEARTGLDHLSLRVADRAELEAWATRLDELGIDHSPIADEPYGSVLVFRDPDNIQLELFVNP